MNITIHNTFLPTTDFDAALAFYRDALGFEVRLDVGYEDMRWITIGSPDQPSTSVVLYPPGGGDPGVSEDEVKTMREMMAKGTFASIILAAEDVNQVFEQVEASGAEVIQEPTDQDYGVRDCAFRDPSGNMVRIQQRQQR